MSINQRQGQRGASQLRKILVKTDYTKHAAGSVLVEFGDTRVICTASFVEGVPRFLKGSNRGWLTAEYGMLPGSTHERVDREAVRGKQTGRTMEIQRLIGRVLRTTVDFEKFGENTLQVDCDVIQADGGTRTASITGGCIAIALALSKLHQQNKIISNPFKQWVAAVSVGIVDGLAMLDLDYQEDSNAETDMNVVMTESGEFIELQGTAEGEPFSETQLNQMISLAKSGIEQLVKMQKAQISK